MPSIGCGMGHRDQRIGLGTAPNHRSRDGSQAYPNPRKPPCRPCTTCNGDCAHKEKIISYAIKKTAQLLDESDNTWHDVYEAPGAEGNCIVVVVPREIREAGNLRKALLRGGAHVPPLDHCHEDLTAASEVEAPVVRRAGATGWRDNHSRFVSHHAVIGGANAGVDVQPPPPRLIKAAGDIDHRGTLDGWQDLIEIARFSTAMIIALCAVFAAPLLHLLKMPNFGLVLVGPSRCGKSTAQLVGASAMGFGQEEHLPTLNATPAGLSEAARVFNDHALPINEVGTARGAKKDVHVVMRDATYALMSGRDVMRHSTWGSGDMMSSSFHVLALMSSEHSPDDWAARGGEARDPGETARLIGTPVLYGDAMSVFDVYNKVPLAQRPAHDRIMFERLRNGLSEHNGIAFKTYIEALTSNLPTFVERAKDDATIFRDAVSKHATTPIERDIVSKFGILYAGGMAAIDAAVLPLSEKRVGSALMKACKAALAALPDSEADLKADLLVLMRHLDGSGVIDADEASTSKKRMMEAADGYHEKAGLGRLYTLRSTRFSRLFRSDLRARKVLDWLDDEGYLRHSRERAPGICKKWAKTQVTWPDGKRVWSFCLYFPGTLDVLDLDA